MLVFFWQREMNFFAYGRQLGSLYYWCFQVGWLGVVYTNQEWGTMFGKAIQVANFAHRKPGIADKLGEAYMDVLKEKLGIADPNPAHAGSGGE